MSAANQSNPAKRVRGRSTGAILYAASLVLRLKPRLFALGLVNELIGRTAPFAQAFLAARIVTTLPLLANTGSRQQALHTIIGILLAVLLVEAVTSASRSLFQLYSRKHEVELEGMVARQLREKFARLPYARYEEKVLMDQYELATSYANRVGNFVMWELREFAGSLYTLVLAAVALLHISWLMAVILAVVAVPQFMLELRVNREQRKQWRNTTTVRRKAYTFEDLLRPQTIKESRLFGLVSYAIQQAYRYGTRSQIEQVTIEQRAEKYRIGLRAVAALAETGSLVYVISLIYRGLQPIGQFVYVQQIVQQYASALGSVAWNLQAFDDFLQGAQEFRDFMALPEVAPGSVAVPTGDIRLEAVDFSYPGAKRKSLQNISLTIPQGSTVAIVGENGAGKTTLVKLLMKLYQPTGGTITIGNQPLADLDETAWHSRLGVLFQDFISFQDFTIRDNVRFGRIEAPADTAKIDQALRQAGAEEFVTKLPKAADTYLGTYMDEKNGVQLSGGQLQRLAIARVLYRDPHLLIMDEPTSAVDAKAEYAIFQAIEKARKNRTTILISHRFSTVRKADHIFVLHNGRLVEQGSHQMLVAQDGRYASLFNAQAEGYR